MAKRITGVEKTKTTRSRKTAKRLAIKKEMLAKKAEKKGGKWAKFRTSPKKQA